MRRLCALALLAALGAASFVSEAVAANTIIQWYDSINNKNITVEEGTTQSLPVREQDRDRNYNVLTNLLSAVNLNAGNAVSNSVDPIPLGVFSRGELLVTWAFAAAADSDSVNIAIYITKKSSPASGIKYNQGIALTGGTVDSTYVQNFPTAKPIPTYYITRNNLVNLAVAGAGATSTIYRFPLSVYRLGASTTGIAISLADAMGPLLPGWYLEVTVANLHPRKNLTDVQVDFLPRVW